MSVVRKLTNHLGIANFRNYCSCPTQNRFYRNLTSSTFKECGYIKISPLVRDHVRKGKPVIALESTILTHGLPTGTNKQTGELLEQICRSSGVLGATIGVIDGYLKVGLSSEEIEFLCSGDPSLRKISRRDLSVVYANKQSGGTTVSATLIGCCAASIPIFATGGLGGVHRDVRKSWDISADLEELSRSPIAVVCSGVKSILDIPKTLEYLETKGVTVVSYKTDLFPTFFSNSSQIMSPNVCKDVDEISKVLKFTQQSGLGSGLVVANPVPSDVALQGEKIEVAIENAIFEATECGVSGKNFTPFVLDKVRLLTNNASLESNLALVQNNVKLACELAIRYCKIGERNLSNVVSDSKNGNPLSDQDSPSRYTLIIGGINVDITIKPKERASSASTESSISMSLGGVGRNISEALSYLGGNPVLISSLGKDSLGKFVRQSLPTCDKFVTESVKHPTSIYTTVLSSDLSDTQFGFAQSDVHSEVNIEVILKNESLFKNADVVIHDGNIPPESSRTIMNLCEKYEVPLLFEPTDYVGCTRFVSNLLENKNTCKVITPNIKELYTLNKSLEFLMKNEKRLVDFEKARTLDELITTQNALHVVCENSNHLLTVSDILLVSMGSSGLVVASRKFSHDDKRHLAKISSSRTSSNCAEFFLIDAEQSSNLVSCSGAGDSFVAGFVSDYYIKKKNLAESVERGMKCAKESLETVNAINKSLKNLI